MLTLLPIIILLLAAVGILVIDRLRPNYSYVWLVAVGATLVSWGFLLAQYWLQTTPFEMILWRPGEGQPLLILLQLDQYSWPFAFSLVSLLLSVILTATGRLELEIASWMWAGSLGMIGVGLLAVMSGNPLTFILMWTLVDLVEMVFVLRNLVAERFEFGVAAVFIIRLVGTMLVAWAMMVSQSIGAPMTIENVLPGVSLYLLLAAMLRLGVFPIRAAYIRELRQRRGLGTILRLVAPASGFAFLGHLPVAFIPPQWTSALLFMAGIGAFFSAVAWLVSEDALAGRPYLLLYFASFALASVVRGQPLAAVIWGVVLILIGGLIFLHSLPRREFLFVPLIGFIGISGLPFTPAAGGWVGLIRNPFNFWNMLFLLSQAMMIAGYFRHMLKVDSNEKKMERWVYVIYPTGLVLLALVQWFIAASGRTGSLTPGIWWAAVLSVLIAVSGSLGSRYWSPNLSIDPGRISWLTAFGGRIRNFFIDLFGLKWLYAIIRAGYELLRQVIRFGTEILEGDAGILWALLLLTLLISLVIPGESL